MAKFNDASSFPENSKVFISGKITGNEEIYKEKFEVVKVYLEFNGHTVMSPSVLPLGFDHGQYLEICYKMIDACEVVVFIHDWVDSKGSKFEHDYAIASKKSVYEFDELIALAALQQLEDLKEENRGNMRTERWGVDPDSVYLKDFMALDWVLRRIYEGVIKNR